MAFESAGCDGTSVPANSESDFLAHPILLMANEDDVGWQCYTTPDDNDFQSYFVGLP